MIKDGEAENPSETSSASHSLQTLTRVSPTGAAFAFFPKQICVQAHGLSGLKLTLLSNYTEDEDTAVDNSKKGAELQNMFNIYLSKINLA